MALSAETLQPLLCEVLQSSLGPGDISGLSRLSSGANNETWLFQYGQRDWVLRRRPMDASETATSADNGPLLGIGLADEAALLELAACQGVPVPAVLSVFDQSHPLGESYIMSRLEGEALPQRWLREPDFSVARRGLAFACGEALAAIHRIDVQTVPLAIPRESLRERFGNLQARLRASGDVSPVMQLGLNWLRERAPADDARVLLHGDFRTGNLLVTPSGLSGVLDWELAHVGPAAEDLGYLCASVWRFGVLDQPVGGFGDYQALLDGYASVAGWSPSISEVKYWEAFAALGWGFVCLTMGQFWQSGADRSLERAAVARRRSEAELDLLLAMDALDD